MTSSTVPRFDRSVPPSTGGVRPFQLPEVRSARLPSGLELRSMARGAVPLVSAALVVDAGEARVAAGREGIASLTADALQGGTLRRSGTELAEVLERLGSGLRVSTGWDSVSVGFTCLADRLDAMLGLLSEVVREPSFPATEVERMRSQRLASLRQRKMDPGALADDELDRDVFPRGHPFHRPLAGTEESVAALDREGILAFAAEAYSPAGGGLVLVGDLSTDQVSDLANTHFGTWTARPAATAAVPSLDGAGARSVRIVHREGSVQSELRLGHPGPSRGHPDEIPLRVANAVLGGSMTSRLNMSLREKHGFTYGARSAFEARKGGGAFTFSTAVQTEVTAPALAEAVAVIERFVASGPEPAELARARDYLAGVFPLRMETTAQLATRLIELVIYGLENDYHHQYRDRIRAVDVECARAVSREHIRPDELRVVMVGDAGRIAREVEGLGLGPVVVEGA